MARSGHFLHQKRGRGAGKRVKRAYRAKRECRAKRASRAKRVYERSELCERSELYMHTHTLTTEAPAPGPSIKIMSDLLAIRRAAKPHEAR